MEVILLQKMGSHPLGTILNVARGYAMNYLIPAGFAARATEQNKVDFEARRAEWEQKAQAALEAAQARASALVSKTVVIQAKASEEGKLYGSVGTRELSEAISQTGVAVSKSEIRLPHGALRVTGEHQVELNLHSDVSIVLTVQVNPEK